jgi:ubiquinone/menaquinone biosynthesis C-methylase UbiE
MNETKAAIKSYWDRRSSTFDLSPGHTLSSKREEDAWKALFRNKIGQGNKLVLDVGAGTGFLSIMLAEIGYSVVGVDLSEDMIKNAQRKMDARGLKVRLELGDAEDLPFEDESFDALVNRAVLWTLPDPKKALSEWKRVLKPGGTLCFFLHGPHSKSQSHQLSKQLTNLVILARERRNPWQSLYDSVDLPMGGGVDSSIVIDLLKKVGFIDVSFNPLSDIAKMKHENMPWLYRISSQMNPQNCYSCRKAQK